VIDPGYRHRRVVDNSAERYRASPRVLPEDWIPMVRTTYEELRDLAGGLGLEIVLAGAGAYSVHVLADPTKYIDYVLSKPIDVRAMIDLYERFVDRLDRKGLNVVADLLARPQVIINRHPFQADHWFPPSIRVYICHLRGSRGGQRSPRSPSSRAPKNQNLRRLINLHPRPEGRGFQL
jgi:hypothetical protein